MNEIPISTPTARFSTTANHARMGRWPMRNKKGTIASTGMILGLEVRNSGDLSVVTDLLHDDSKKSLFNKFGPAPVSTGFATVSMTFAEIQTDKICRLAKE